MCGICGFVVEERQEAAIEKKTVLARMTGRIRHRGPNDEGYYIGAGIGLGMRRLSIIDVAGGQQPIWNEKKDICLVFNGEIYNHVSLRKELSAKGHRFSTRCDTEVIVHAYEEYGSSFPEHLNGMFAIALYDLSKQKLIIVRDRLGIKPLYYYQNNGIFLFASEMKSFLEFPLFSAELDPPATLKSTLIGFTPCNATPLRGVYKVNPGCYIEVSTANGMTVREQTYWDLCFGEESSASLEELAEQFGDLLRDAVEKRLMSEVPLGVLLSGGIDSSVITYLAGECSGKKVTTFSMRFEEELYDEGEFIGQVANSLGTEHYELVFSPGSYDDFPDFFYHMEEFTISIAAAYPMFQLARFIREHGFTVLLSGQGSDELLCGYPWFRLNQILSRINKYPWPFNHLLRTVGIFKKAVLAKESIPIQPKNLWMLENIQRSPLFRYYGALCPWLNIRNGTSELAMFFNPEFIADARVSEQNLEDSGLEGADSRWGLMQFFQYCEIKRRLCDFILMEMDRFSMAHSLEYRVPFLDHRLVEFCLKLPEKFKVREDQEKIVLRHWAKGKLPEEVRTRKKKGFQSRVGLFDGSWPQWLEEALSETNIRKTGILDVKNMERVKREYRAGNDIMLLPLIFATNIQLFHDKFCCQGNG